MVYYKTKKVCQENSLSKKCMILEVRRIRTLGHLRHSQSTGNPFAPKYDIYLFLHINFSNEIRWHMSLWVGMVIWYIIWPGVLHDVNCCPLRCLPNYWLSSLSELASHSHFNHIQVEQSTIIIMITTLETREGCSVTFLVQEFFNSPNFTWIYKICNFFFCPFPLTVLKTLV